MEVQGYVLEGISKLRCLSITEIVFGVLGAIGILANFSRSYGGRVGGSVGNLIITVLLLAAGSLGVHAVNKARAQVLDPNTFRICGILNIILCIVYALQMIIFVVAGILLAVAPTTGLQLLEHFGIVPSGTSAELELSKAYYGTDVHVAVGAAVIVTLVICIIACVLMIALTATAAKIARRNQAIILAGPRGAVAGYPLSPPGYTQYSPVKTQEMHHA